MDLFNDKNIKPMIIGAEGEPFDSNDYIYELKFDGERCIAYIDKNSIEIRNKRNFKMLTKVPELTDIYNQINTKCILDGELTILKDGKPDFFEIQRRSLTSNPIKIKLAAQKYPASFIAFDILFYNSEPVMDRPLMHRKELLEKVFKNESSKFAISRYIEKDGINLFNETTKNNLEGIVAKKKNSKYYLDKRTKEWIKIKNFEDDDFVICGYIYKEENNVTSLVLGQYMDNTLIYKGHVTLGVSKEAFNKIYSLQKLDVSPFEGLSNNDDVIWVEPTLVCTVKYMMKNTKGGMRQPVFKGLREDKEPKECITNYAT